MSRPPETKKYRTGKSKRQDKTKGGRVGKKGDRRARKTLGYNSGPWAQARNERNRKT